LDEAMFNGKDGEIVLVIGGMLGCEENIDLKVRVSVVEACGFVRPTRWLHTNRISN
jgi:hypothetical protein